MNINRIKSKISSILITFKLILTMDNNWEAYKDSKKYVLREVEKLEVEKMIGCKDPKKGGYRTYICPWCGHDKIIAHTCKSRICSTCGKKHADEWAEKINKELYAINYRHVILTIPDKLWEYFEGNSKMQKLMLDTAGDVMKEIVRKFNKNKRKIEAGIVMVLHPFGSDLKTNMHVHMLITEGGLTTNGKWVEMNYINYKLIRKKWQYKILTNMKKAMPNNVELSELVNWCFKNYKEGFNIQAKRRIEGKTKKAARYMARYVRHPAIANSRIIGYDGSKVTFIYKREKKEIIKTVEKDEFINSVIKHIPDKNFKMVRYFGIHGRRAKKSVREIMGKLGLVVKYIIKKFSWRKNIKEYKGKDPLECEKCGEQMELYNVVYIDKNGEQKIYGGFEQFIKRIQKQGVVMNEKKEKSERKKEYAYSQICMF